MREKQTVILLMSLWMSMGELLSVLLVRDETVVFV